MVHAALAAVVAVAIAVRPRRTGLVTVSATSSLGRVVSSRTPRADGATVAEVRTAAGAKEGPAVVAAVGLAGEEPVPPPHAAAISAVATSTRALTPVILSRRARAEAERDRPAPVRRGGRDDLDGSVPCAAR